MPAPTTTTTTTITTTTTPRQVLLDLYLAGLASVSGQQAVAQALAQDSKVRPDSIIAVGKAASAMCQGALSCFPGIDNALVITKYQHASQIMLCHDKVSVLESGHPVPDQQSLLAGQQLLSHVRNMQPGSGLLLLVSGGASALAEVLPANMPLEYLQSLTHTMLASGKSISEINDKRKLCSKIKDGKLIQQFNGSRLWVYALSDVQGDDIATIGSGIGDCHRAKLSVQTHTRIIASNKTARQHVAQTAAAMGLNVLHNQPSLYGDVFAVAANIAQLLCTASPGIYIWGGESTIVLPKHPGQGGRNQSLALAIAKYLPGHDNITVLVAATDGTDGPTKSAGGIVDSTTFGDPEAALAALENADAGPWLKKRGQLLVTGPTDTNVMDLVIALVD